MSVLLKLLHKPPSPPVLLSYEAKFAFHSHPGNISKLASQQVCVEFVERSDIYWYQVCQVALCTPWIARLIAIAGVPYTVLFDSASDVFSLVSPQDSELRSTRKAW
jgi:hypothetical protein